MARPRDFGIQGLEGACDAPFGADSVPVGSILISEKCSPLAEALPKDAPTPAGRTSR